MECVAHRDQTRRRISTVDRMQARREASSHASLREIHEMGRVKGNNVSWSHKSKRTRRSVYGLLWIVTLSLLPLAIAQSPTAAPIASPTAVSTTSAPVQAPVSRRPTPQPASLETAEPSVAVFPTPKPSNSQRPSVVPTVSLRPTGSLQPTGLPSESPSDFPSIQPSHAPTAEPTFVTEISARTVFNQRFQIGGESEFNATEKTWFCKNMEGYTADFGGTVRRVNTTCWIISQRLQVIGAGNRRLRDGLNDDNKRRLQGVVFNQVEYGMSYRSNHTNVTNYTTLFQNYVNEDLDRLTADLQNAGLAVTNSFLAFNNIATVAPSMAPTGPTVAPSIGPSMAPSIGNFTRPPGLPVETAVPSLLEPTAQAQGGDDKKRVLGNSTIIAISVGATFFIVLVALFVFYRRRKRANERKFQAEAAAAGAATTATGASGWTSTNSRNDMLVDTGQPLHDTMKNGKPENMGLLSPADSLRSKDSLISTGPSPLSDSSERELDSTYNLADEFDEYKDQNLERMRNGVEGNLSGFDGMMSQALTKALIDDDSEAIDNGDLRWGGTGDSIEIEATALYEVTDWLKRNDGATMEEK